MPQGMKSKVLWFYLYLLVFRDFLFMLFKKVERETKFLSKRFGVNVK